jgi:hypothetical protein
MIDLGDGSDNMRVDESVRPADLDFWFGRSAKPVSSSEPIVRPTFGQMIGARAPVVRAASPQTRTAPAPSATVSVDEYGQPQQLARPEIDGALQLLSREGWNRRVPASPAQKEKARQYLVRAGWDGKTPPTPDDKGKAYRFALIDAPR